MAGTLCRLLAGRWMTRCATEMRRKRRSGVNSSKNQTALPPTGSTVSPAFCWSLALLILALGGLAITGCQSDSIEFDSDSGLTAGVRASLYSTNELHEGDVVNITFQYATNFNTLQKITLDGQLNLDMVGPVRAAGKSETELQQELSRLYRPLAKDDVITVKLVSSTASVYVSGAVLRPGMVEMDRPLTVIEAVMGAGGFDNSRAKLSDVTVLRIEQGREHAYHVNLKRVLAGNDETPFYLKPFDIIYVPAKTFNY